MTSDDLAPVAHGTYRDTCMSSSLPAFDEQSIRANRISEHALAETKALLLGRNENDVHVLAPIVAQNLAVMRPNAYESWIESMRRNFFSVRDAVGVDYRAGATHLCALIQGVHILKRRVEMTKEQEFSLLVICFALLREGHRKKTEFFYEDGDGITLKDVGLVKFFMSVPADSVATAVQRLVRLMQSVGSAPLRSVEIELALSGGMVPVMRVGGL